MMNLGLFQWLGLCIVVGAFAIYIQRIDQRMKVVKNQLGRLSLTFIKIENDLCAIQDSIVMLSRGQSEDIQKEVLRMRNAARYRFKDYVANGPNLSEIMRGLELPDIDEDPAFWSKDRMRKFGFESRSDESDSKP